MGWCGLSVHRPEQLRQPTPRAPRLHRAAPTVTPQPHPLAATVLCPHGSVFGACPTHGPAREITPDAGPSAGRSEPGIHPSCASIICSFLRSCGDCHVDGFLAVPSPDAGHWVFPVWGICEQSGCGHFCMGFVASSPPLFLLLGKYLKVELLAQLCIRLAL